MTPPEPDLNPLAVLVLLATAAGVSPQIAAAAGTYGLVTFAWFAGALIGLWRIPPTLRIRVAGFLAVSCIVTLGVAVPLAKTLARQMPLLDAQAALFLLALAIPAVGHSWLDVAAWLAGLLRRRAERRLPPADDGGSR